MHTETIHSYPDGSFFTISRLLAGGDQPERINIATCYFYEERSGRRSAKEEQTFPVGAEGIDKAIVNYTIRYGVYDREDCKAFAGMKPMIIDILNALYEEIQPDRTLRQAFLDSLTKYAAKAIWHVPSPLEKFFTDIQNTPLEKVWAKIPALPIAESLLQFKSLWGTDKELDKFVNEFGPHLEKFFPKLRRAVAKFRRTDRLNGAVQRGAPTPVTAG